MKDRDQYHALREGGRVKSAGLSVDFIFQQGETFKSDPGAETAAQITKTFHTLRENPPGPFRERFFPLDRAEVKAMTRRTPALYRPVFKNDQGAGMFLPFQTHESEGGKFPYNVKVESGYVIPETYFYDQVSGSSHAGEIERELVRLRASFGTGDFKEARLAFEGLQTKSEESGIVFRRRAGVGRNGVMFIHPAQAEESIVVPEKMTQEIETRVNRLLEELCVRAEEEKRLFAQFHNLPFKPIDERSYPIYSQADVHVFRNGNFEIAELQVPDVGLFLNGLDPYGNEVLEQVQKIVEPLQKKVIDRFEDIIERTYLERGKVPIYLVTRGEVISDKEDMLEIRELAEIKKELAQRGYTAHVIDALSASEIDRDSLLFLFNLNPNTDEFHRLAKAHLSDTACKMIMIPDPFVRVVEREMTEYKKVTMSEKQIANFASLVGEIESPDGKKDKVYGQVMAVDYFLRQLGIEEDVLHFDHQKFLTPIPVYRYDLRSHHIASSMISEAGLKEVTIKSIPISPGRGILLNRDGGTLYATLRFMFVRK